MATGARDWDKTTKTFTTGQGCEQIKISVSDTDSVRTFSKTVYSVLIYNGGSSKCYVNFEEQATTNNFCLEPGTALSIDVPVSSIHAICDSGKSTVLYVIGVWYI